MSIEAMKQALEALDTAAFSFRNVDAITALRTAIEAAEKQEPSYYGLTDDHLWMSVSKKQYDSLKPAFRMACYTTPPAAQRQWVGLTDEEIKEIIGPWGDTPIRGYTRKLFDQIEAKLKEKNT